MLCSHGLHSALSPVMDLYWPVCSLWPDVKPLLYQQELLQRNLQERRSSLELMEKLQHNILEETEPFRSSVTLRPLSYQLEKEGERFGLTLDTQGSYSYRHQEFRQEFDLPEGLNPEAVTCYLAPDGKLHIQASRAPSVEEAERELTIKRSSEEKTQQLPSVCSHTEGSCTETHNSKQDKPEDMDSATCCSNNV